MFDRLIVSSEGRTRSDGRSRYFLVSSLVVGTLFATAVVLSLYAAEISIGDDRFDMSVMLAPVSAEIPEPERPDPRPDLPETGPAEKPIRNDLIARIDDLPAQVPDSVSTVKPTSLSLPKGEVVIDPSATERIGTGVSDGRRDRTGDGGSLLTGSSTGPDPALSAPAAAEPPPPVRKAPPAPTTPISIGVVNGRAISLPKPPYPPTALSVGVEGEVTVQVTIDEKGRVVSAKAAKGHPLLRTAAERAAMDARFTPTLLSEVPVKVTGVIIYNFKRG